MAESKEVYAGRLRALTFLRPLAVVVGGGLIGWAIRGPAGFAMGLGAGLVLLGLATVAAAALLARTLGEAHEGRVALDLDDFRRLIRGHQVVRSGIRIRLRDIGWMVMLAEVQQAYREGQRAAEGGVS